MTTEQAAPPTIPFPRLVEVADKSLARLREELRVAEVAMDNKRIEEVRRQMDTALDMRSRGTGTSAA